MWFWNRLTINEGKVAHIIKANFHNNFKKTAGKDGMKYLENRTYPGPVMNGMLVWMGENQAEGADAAIEFLKTQEDVWSKWVSGGAKKKIKAAL
mgnify:CR=1 FL=1